MTQAVTIVGAGWAGLAAAIKATQQGWTVHLIEATQTPGGRAKSVNHQGKVFDNGQHALIGAYQETLSLMKTLGLEPDALFERQGLGWCYSSGAPFGLPKDPLPFKTLRSLLLNARFSPLEKLSLLKPVQFWIKHRFLNPSDTSVAQLFHGVSDTLMRDIISPLCLSALNTPLDRASASTFVRVLKDAFSNPPDSCSFLFPKKPLSDIFPIRSLEWLKSRGARIELGRRIDALNDIDVNAPCILAVPAWQAAKLTRDSHPNWSGMAGGLTHKAIASVYIKGHPKESRRGERTALQSQLVCFNEHMELDNCVHPQFGIRLNAQAMQTPLIPPALQGTPPEHWALIVSVADPHRRQDIVQNAMAVARNQLGLEDLDMQFCTIEKRATFSCEALSKRPPTVIAQGLFACGDYVQGPYPSTLEGAVRSGLRAVACLDKKQTGAPVNPGV